MRETARSRAAAEQYADYTPSLVDIMYTWTAWYRDHVGGTFDAAEEKWERFIASFVAEMKAEAWDEGALHELNAWAPYREDVPPRIRVANPYRGGLGQ